MEKEDNPNELKSLPISQWAEEDKPREKMIMKGKKNLTNRELLAILLRTGIPGMSAIDLAQSILQLTQGSLTDLARLEVSELQRNFKGIGQAKAVTILAALELGNRMLSEHKDKKEEIITNSQELFKCIAPSLIDLPHEEFWAVYLNQRNKVSWKQRISSGGFTNTAVDLRIIFGAALEHRAVAIAVAHNHPSGALRPSTQDKELTRHIADAGKILNIKLIEHIIVGVTPEGKSDYFSFAENGLL